MYSCDYRDDILFENEYLQAAVYFHKYFFRYIYLKIYGDNL